MKYLALAALGASLLSPTAVLAQQSAEPGINTQKFCMYAGQLYSIGALIEVGDQVLECRYFPGVPDEGIEAGARWAQL